AAMATPVPPVGTPPPAGPSGRKAAPTSKLAESRIPASEPVEPMKAPKNPAEKSAAVSVPTAAIPLSLYSSRTHSPAACACGVSRVTSHSEENCPPWPHRTFDIHHADQDVPSPSPSGAPSAGTTSASAGAHCSNSCHV